MNASEIPERFHRAYICLGSNIDPINNIRRAVDLLRSRTRLVAISSCWETPPVGSAGKTRADKDWPNFLNVAALLVTQLGVEELKQQVLRKIEQELGRVRTADKYAPRTIDLDISIYDEQVLDPELWHRAYMALTFAELLPDLRNPVTGETLRETAERWKQQHMAISRADVAFG